MPTNSSHYHQLKDKWSRRQNNFKTRIFEKHKDSLSWLQNKTKHLAVGSLGSFLLLSAPTPLLLPTPIPHALILPQKTLMSKDAFLHELSAITPAEVRPLNASEEDAISKVITQYFGITAVAQLDGKRLNRSYGFIGAEQHLARYPGDSLYDHFDSENDVKQYMSSGMAPGLGAWGYFAQSKNQFTELDKQRERYYIAVPTFLSEDFQNKVAEYRDFYKYRKMLVVNPENGKAIVVDIGDAGPAVETGKHLGGSPAVMRYLERVDGAQKGPVIYFFLDDKNDAIPLGPLTMVQ